MSLNSIFDDLTDVFTDPEKFGERVLFYPGGDPTYPTKRPVYVVWDEGDLIGTNEVEGDGVTLQRNGGFRIRESVTIEAPTSLVVAIDDKAPGKFERADGTIVRVKRILSKDASMQSILCIRSEDKYMRNVSRRG